MKKILMYSILLVSTQLILGAEMNELSSQEFAQGRTLQEFLKINTTPLIVKFDDIYRLDLSHKNLNSIDGIEDLEFPLGEHFYRSSEEPKFVRLSELKGLLEIDLSDNKLQSLPASIGQLTNLLRLDLKHNQLETLPEEIGNLSNLYSLDLQYNALKTLPDSFEKLTLLAWLNLSHNKLSWLPASIGQLTNLLQLDLSYNQLQILLKGIGNLSKLRYLNMDDNNQLKTLPKEVGNLSNLETLFLSDGQLAQFIMTDKKGDTYLVLPEEIRKLSKLQLLGNSHGFSFTFK